MKKILLKDLEHFHAWQAKTIKKIDNDAQVDVSVMPQPAEYPVILVWDFHEDFDVDSRHPNQPKDVFSYKYIYLGDFPMKCIKRGTYVYQVFQTNDVCEV